MAAKIVAFTLPKLGETRTSNQDRFAHSRNRSRVALADGAGSSLYPGEWAELLVQAFCNDDAADDPIAQIRQDYQAWLAQPQQAWRQLYLDKLQTPNRKWWQGGSELKACGFSTFLGLRLDPNTLRWQAVAVGDSCLFKLAADTQQLEVFPQQTSQAFKSTTPCFASLPEHPSSLPQFAAGEYQTGDIFLLATDALAHWLLSSYELRGELEDGAWQRWFRLKAHREFMRAIAQLRKQQQVHNQRIHNDDMTMVLLTVQPEGQPGEQPELQPENQIPNPNTGPVLKPLAPV